MAPLKIAFIGWGAINSRVNALLAERGAPIEIVGIATRTKRPTGVADVSFLERPESLAHLKPDLVVEAAGREAVAAWAPVALCHARAMIIASTSALCDENFLSSLRKIAEMAHSRILIPAGAIGAIDALAAAAVLPLDEVVHQVAKPPLAWRNTEAERRIDLAAISKRQTFFRGSAREAAALFPQNANATVVTSLAGIGLDQTRVELIADPDLKRNQHRIRARGAFGSLQITLENEALATNPKSSELTALSLVRLIERQISPVVI
jgi:aspartate dehydrogenase